MTPPNNPKSGSVPPKAEGVETQKDADQEFVTDMQLIQWMITYGVYAIHSHVSEEGKTFIYRGMDSVRFSEGFTLLEALLAGYNKQRQREKLTSVGRGNAASPPPGNPKESCVAAAAEDVAPWDYKHVRDIILRGHSDLSLELEERNPHFSGSCEAKSVHGYDILAYDHNLCVSRLRERADRFEKLSKVQHEWGCEGKQFTHIDNVVRLQEQIKTLKNEIAMRKAANWTVSEEEIFQKANETNFTLIARAEEAEAKLAKIISEKS